MLASSSTGGYPNSRETKRCLVLGLRSLRIDWSAGVVREHEQKVRMCVEDLGTLFHRQDPAVIGQRMNQNCCVLACLDDLVEVADATLADGPRERAIDPNGLVALEQIAAYEIGRGEILVDMRR